MKQRKAPNLAVAPRSDQAPGRESPPSPKIETRTGQNSTGSGFFIVGLGASAGGLEAFEKFFTHLPGDSRKGKIIRVNLSGADLLGVKRGLLIDQPFHLWLAPKFREAFRAHLQKGFETGGQQTCDLQLPLPDGSSLHVASEGIAAPGEVEPAGRRCRTAMSDITDRKQAEKELTLKERLLDGVSDSIFLHDLDGHFLYLNEAAYKDRGYEKEELLAKDLSVLIAPEFAGVRGSLLNDLMAKGEITFESAHLRKDGSVMPVEIHARTINLAGRQLILSAARDITERKIAEHEIKLNEARFASLLRISQYEPESIQDLLDLALHEAIALTSSKIGFIYFYDAEKKQFTLNTWSKEVITEGSLVKYQSIDELEKTGIWGEAVRQARPIMVNEVLAPHPLKQGDPEGHAKLYKYLTIPVFSGDRMVAVMAVANKETAYVEADVRQLTLLTDAVWKIVDRRRAEQGLITAASQWRTTFDTIGDAIFLLDLEGNILQCNRAAADLAAKPLADIIGRPCWEAIHGTAGPIADCPVVRLQQSRHRETLTLAWGDRWLHVTADPILNQAGELIGVVHLIADLTEMKQAEEKLRKSYGKLQRTLEETVSALAATSETRDPYTSGHQKRVAQLACAIAREMGLPEHQIRALGISGQLHDIGKMSVPAEILSKPGKISEMEFNLIKAHPEVGYNIVKGIHFPCDVAEAVRQHHERLDGSGYPRGLAGPEIVLEARILAVADVVEAMASHRPYRPAWGIEVALDEITKNKGRLYDPEVVDACVRLFTEKGFRLEG